MLFPSPAYPVKRGLGFFGFADILCDLCVVWGVFWVPGSVLDAPTMFAECQVSSVHTGLDTCFKTNALVCRSFRFQSPAEWVVWMLGGAL